MLKHDGSAAETDITFSYRPGPNGGGGVFCACTEDAARVSGEWRLALLLDLAARTADARTWQDACERSAAALSAHPDDLPFALIYVAEPDGTGLFLAGASGIEPGHPVVPERLDPTQSAPWPLAAALAGRGVMVVEDRRGIGDAPPPAGAWSKPPGQVALVPIVASGQAGRGGILIVGLKPFQVVDDAYRHFLLLVSGQITASMASAHAYAEEDRVLADSRMPGPDGFGVYHERQAGPDLSHRPVIGLSAHLGEAVRLEGMAAGAMTVRQDSTGNKRTEAALRWSSQRAELLSDTAARLLESDDPQGLVEDLCRKVMVFLDCHVFFNFLVDDAVERLRLNACAGISEGESRKIEWLDYGVAVCGCVARDRQRLVAEDILQTRDRRTALVKSYGIQAYCCHPLLMQGRLLGTLSFGTRSRPCFSPDDIAVMKAVTDLVAVAMHRLETQRALRLSEARYRALVTASSQVIYRLNAEWTEMHYLYDQGFPANPAGPSGTWLEHYVLPEDQPHVTAAIQDAIRTKSIFELEHRVRRADGSLGWTFSRAVPLLDAEGAIVEWFGAASDITARKQAEEALRDADRRKDEFLATLAHELRNPLAPVRNALALMKRADGNAELMRRCQEMMERQIGHLVRLIDDLLDVSRITHGKLELKRERIVLASVVAQAVETCHPQVESAGHDLHVQVPQEPILLEADPVRLVQVIGNLLTNACKYTPPGGRIWLTAEREGNQVQLTVKDTGVGLSPDLLLTVFQPFTQVKRSPEHAPGGLGIGLSLVKRLVEMHAGTVTARSAGPGCGSEFAVRLPILVEPLAAQTTELLAYPVSETARRILVIDDNRDAADSLAVLLRVAGNDTRTAYDGETGLKVAATFRPEVILLDLGMPTLDGYDTCRRLREQPWSKGMTVVALTGWGQEEARRKTRVAGFDGHLVKPVDNNALMTLITRRRAEVERPLPRCRNQPGKRSEPVIQRTAPRPAAPGRS